LSCDESDLDKALCSRVVAARGEVVEKGHTLEQAQFGRDAFAKVNWHSMPCPLQLANVLMYFLALV
jgi:myosin heavy subunit